MVHHTNVIISAMLHLFMSGWLKLDNIPILDGIFHWNNLATYMLMKFLWCFTCVISDKYAGIKSGTKTSMNLLFHGELSHWCKGIFTLENKRYTH